MQETKDDDMIKYQEFFGGVSEETIENAMKKKFASLSGHTLERRIKIGRNDPCPCDSGLKFKRCCIDKVNDGITHLKV